MKLLEGQCRYVDNPEARLLEALLTQAVMDIQKPSRLCDEAQEKTARNLIASGVLEEILESGGLQVCPNAMRERLGVPRNRLVDESYGIMSV